MIGDVVLYTLVGQFFQPDKGSDDAKIAFLRTTLLTTFRKHRRVNKVQMAHKEDALRFINL